MYRRFNRAAQPPRFICAKKASTCPETGKPISVGETIAWFPASGKAFHNDSKAASDLRSQQFAQNWHLADANY
jgi:hypothetical protein